MFSACKPKPATARRADDEVTVYIQGFSLDLACKFPKIASLEGISSISSSRLGKVYLLVTGDAPDSWNGTVTGNVSIQYGDEARLDGFRMLVK